jgi:DNA polymerase-1
MLVSDENLDQCIHEMSHHLVIGVDTETTGLQWWQHVLFSIQVATLEDVYFFYHPTDRQIEKLKEFFANPTRTAYAANAKFDMHFLASQGIDIAGPVVCLTTRERIIKNNLFPVTEYNLEAMAQRRLGIGKDDFVEEYIMSAKLYDTVVIPGKKKVFKALRFDKVPLHIIQPYAERDANLHLDVGLSQEKDLLELGRTYGASDVYGSILDVAANEVALTKTCFKMERVGIKVDVPYTDAAMAYENEAMLKLKEDFQLLTKLSYQDSSKVFVDAFDRLGLKYPLTDKGNPCFNAEALDEIQNPVAELIQKIRGAEKKIGTYYSSFLYYKDNDNVIHPNMRQSGTETGRFSFSDPNLQNLPLEEKSTAPYVVRGCFEPREDFCFMEFDYRQLEFRLLVDYAGETKLIEAINDGMDPHTATAELTGLTRTYAKTLNFAIVYGAGAAKLGKMMGVPEKDAYAMREQYFAKMPKVGRFISSVNRVGKTRRYVRNRFGRVCHLEDTNFSFILLNHILQGSGADLVKIGMNLIDDKLENASTRMVLQVHDSILLETHKNELDIAPGITGILEGIYKPQNGMKLTTSVAHSWDSFAKRDLKEGLPC